MRNHTIARRLEIVVAGVLGLLACGGVAGAADPLYRLIELDSAEGGSSRAYSINDAGQVVGWMEASGTRHAGHWHVEVVTDLFGTVHFNLQHPDIFGVDYSEAYAISNAGQIVGTARIEIDCPPTITMTNAFVLRPGVLTDLATPYPGDALTNLGTLAPACVAHDSAAAGISNRNHIVGWADTGSGIIHAFLETPRDGSFFVDDNDDGLNDLMIDLGTLTSNSDPVSSATAVNDFGEVTGYSYTLATPAGVAEPTLKAVYHAFLVTPQDTDNDGQLDWFLDDGTGANALMTDLGTLGGYNSWGRDINSAGQVVGEADVDPALNDGRSATHAFFYDGGTMIDLGTLAGNFSAASAINDNGDIVGWASDADGQRRAFLYHDGKMYDLNELICTQTGDGMTFVPNITLTEARDINRDGWIVGWGSTRGSETQETRGFLLIPLDPNDCAAPDDQVAGDTADSSDSSTGNGNDAYSGNPMTGTPGNTSGGNNTPSGNDGATTPTATPALCGVGTLAMLPVMMAGLLGMKTVSRRRPGSRL